ncbi:protein mono-ADP-ribosyltransferase PARP14 [Microcaecilia unicolor]|uniref:Poly [ADP-ribose] polymerase n=1 Tax=Microcaecilia unicolor TaxID=1415580 RepID=A0A6P7WME4_9AMPH|nr:protein mono-ADP-ribosyltransferase PARP14-like [Microcaecilia unicolor]
MEERGQGYSIHVRILGNPQRDITRSLSRFFTNRRKSGGGENQVIRLSSTLYKICFKEKEDQERVLSKEHHEIKLSSTQETIAVQVTHLECNEPTPGDTSVASSCDKSDFTAAPVSDEAEEVSESPHTQDSLPPVRSKSLVPNPRAFTLIEKRLQEELKHTCPGMTWSVDSCHAYLTFEGTSADVLQAKIVLKQLLGMVVERPVELPGYELAFLLTLGKMNILEKKLHEVELEVVLQNDKTSATLLGLDTESVKLASDVLGDLLDHKCLEGVKDWELLNESGGGHTLINSLLQRLNHPFKHVDIRVSPVGTLVNILVVGCTESVKTVVEELKNFLGRVDEPVDPTPTSIVSVCNQEEERLHLPSLSLAEFFDLFLILVGLKDFLKGKVTWSQTSPPSCVIVLRGLKQDIKQARQEVTRKLQDLSSKELVLDKPGMLQYFSSKGKDFLALLLKTHKCLVLLQESKPDFRDTIEEFWFPEFQQTPAAPEGLKFHYFQQLGRMARVHVKNVVIESKLGEVEAEETDAILNLLSSGYDITDTPLFHAAGDSVQKEFRNKESRLGCTYTGAGRLRCKIIIHVRLNWKLDQQNTLKNILVECDSKREYRSVCLFLTDTGNVPPLEAAGILVNALAMTAAQLMHLTLIKIVTSEERLSDALQSKLKSCSGQLVPQEPRKASFLQAFFGFSASDSSNKSSQATKDSWQPLRTKFSSKPAMLQLFTEKQETLEKVTQTINAHISSLYSQCVIRDPALEHLTVSHLEEIYLKLLSTGVVVSKAKDCLKLEGTDPAVEEVKTLVEQVLQELKTMNSEEDKWLLDGVHWQYEEQQRMKDFSTLDSCQLERAYRLGQTEVSLKWEGARKMMVNFPAMQGQVPEDNKCFRVHRKEKLTEKGIPAFWQEMASSRGAKMIQLSHDSLEYQCVEKRFNLSAARYQIQSIERIQCGPLYQAYSLRKKQMEEKNGQEKGNERILYHGTSSETSLLICEHGFNRSLNQRSMFGHGVYFAVNAEYSATYSKPNTDGFYTLIQARVLTGTYTLGRPNLRAVPSRSTSLNHDLFDSVVDKMESPSVFVIFHDSQAYPEYRITFK